jgi:hypothetical protein
MAVYLVFKKEYMWKLAGQGTVCGDAGTHNVIQHPDHKFLRRVVGAQGAVVEADSPADAAAAAGFSLVDAPRKKAAPKKKAAAKKKAAPKKKAKK